LESPIMPEIPEVARLKMLAHELRSDEEPCPFTVDEGAARQVTLPHFNGGRDATYVFVARKWDGRLPLHDVAVTIHYPPFVEGTTIIYDVTDELLQGKARPFVCNLGRKMIRVYAVMPFQVENISLQATGDSGHRQVQAAFLDARHETIQAALPFELRLVGASGKTLLTEYRSTDRSGRFTYTPEPEMPASRAVIRSLLTGREESIAL
jgi:hypothetical protein